MRTLRIAVIAGLLCATAAGCSDDPTSNEVTVEGKPYVRALTTNLADDGVGEIEIDRSQAACVAAKWVNIFQPERLDEAGVSPEDLERDAGTDEKATRVALSDGEVRKLVGAFGECDVDLRQAYLDAITEGAVLSQSDRECLTDAFSDDLVDRMVALLITKGADAVDEDPAMTSDVFDALSACPGAIGAGT